MELTVITPTKTTIYLIAWIEFNTPQGNYVIQPGHIPMIASLLPNNPVIFCLTSGKHETFLVNKGLIHVNRTHIKLFLNH